MLTEALAALATTGSTALVTAMVTDSWEGMKARVARLLGRGDPRQTQVASDRLEKTRAVLAQTPGPALDRVRAEEQIAWQTRLGDLLEADPGAETELRALITQIHSQVAGSAGRVEQHATASDNARQAVLGHGVQNNYFGGQDEPGSRR